MLTPNEAQTLIEDVTAAHQHNLERYEIESRFLQHLQDRGETEGPRFSITQMEVRRLDAELLMRVNLLEKLQKAL